MPALHRLKTLQAWVLALQFVAGACEPLREGGSSPDGASTGTADPAEQDPSEDLMDAGGDNQRHDANIQDRDADRQTDASLVDANRVDASRVDAELVDTGLQALDAGVVDGGDTDESGPITGSASLKLTFSPMYSAYDGMHAFKLPLKVVGASGVLRVSTSPTGFVDYEAMPYGVMLTMRKAGNTTITVVDAAGNSGRAELHVTGASAQDYETGRESYNRSLGSAADGGSAEAQGSCVSCHQLDTVAASVDAGALPVDVEHTPQQTGGYADEELIRIFSEGVKPTGVKFRLVGFGSPAAIAARIFMTFHKWNLTEPAKKGLVVYLRGLEPRSRGELDFGGR